MSVVLDSSLSNSSDRSCAPRYRLWSIDIDPLTMNEAVSRISGWVDSGARDCKWVVTPNVDHVVQLHRNPVLLPIYRDANLTLADGWPLVTMSRLYSKPLPERVPGSDLLPSVCDEFQSRSTPLRLFLLGGMPGVPERAAENIHQNWSHVRVVGTASPKPGFERDQQFNQELCGQINDSQPDIIVVGLGFPKQERWLATHQSSLDVPVAVGVGATIDFLAGEQTRAPKWIQAIKMEWFFRMITDPRRLAARYAIDAAFFPWICWKHRASASVTASDDI